MTRTRRRRLMLVSASVLGAGCSRGEAASNDALGSDAALIARLQRDSVTVVAAHRAAPDSSVRTATTDGAAVCRPVSQPAQLATAALQQDADLQLQLAREAELAGDRRGTRDALRRAARLDPTNIAIAQRLARASDELQDATSAVDEYCRVLALRPSSADSAAVSDRLRQLAAYPPATTTKALAATVTTPRRERTVTRRARSERNSAVTTVERAAAAESTVTYASSGTVEQQRQTDNQPVPPVAGTPGQPISAVMTPANSIPQPASGSGTTMPVNVPGDSSTAATTVASTPAPEQPAPRPRARRSGGVSGRNVMTGAAVGAVLGGVVGRNARSAVIGAAAGGLMGAMARPSRIATGTFARSN